MSNSSALRRELGIAAVVALVIGDILGSGIFYAPGEIAPHAQSSWQIYFLWIFCGLIVLCGTVTVASLSAMLPRAGATYHMIREGWGPFWGFLKIWMEMWVSGPGSVAGIAVLFGTFLSELLGSYSALSPVGYGAISIVFFATINLLGVRWGGRTQILLTVAKVSALLLLVFGAFATTARHEVAATGGAIGILPFLSFVGTAIAAVLYTYDGWIDVTHVAGEIREPERNLMRGLVFGVTGVILIYLLANHAFLRVVPLAEMRSNPGAIATLVAERVFGTAGAKFITALLMVSILGAQSGLIMTLPRLFYAGAVDFHQQAGPRHPLGKFYGLLSTVSRKTAVPAGSIVFCAIISITALLFFQTFSRIVNFFVVSAQTANILAVSSVFRLRHRAPGRIPGYPWAPAIFVITMILLLISVVVYQPFDSAIGIALTCSGIPIYLWLTRKSAK